MAAANAPAAFPSLSAISSLPTEIRSPAGRASILLPVRCVPRTGSWGEREPRRSPIESNEITKAAYAMTEIRRNDRLAAVTQSWPSLRLDRCGHPGAGGASTSSTMAMVHFDHPGPRQSTAYRQVHYAKLLPSLNLRSTLPTISRSARLARIDDQADPAALANGNGLRAQQRKGVSLPSRIIRSVTRRQSRTNP